LHKTHILSQYYEAERGKMQDLNLVQKDIKPGVVLLQNEQIPTKIAEIPS